MLMEKPSKGAQLKIEVDAIVFRDDGGVEAVKLTELSFSDCKIRSDAIFAIGERLRLHLQGQGLIEMRVERASAGEAEAHFVTLCQV